MNHAAPSLRSSLRRRSSPPIARGSAPATPMHRPAATTPEREAFLQALASQRGAGTLPIDPLAIADAILRRER